MGNIWELLGIELLNVSCTYGTFHVGLDSPSLSVNCSEPGYTTGYQRFLLGHFFLPRHLGLLDLFLT